MAVVTGIAGENQRTLLESDEINKIIEFFEYSG